MKCPICRREAMHPSSGSKEICFFCGFVQSCCEAENLTKANGKNDGE